MASSLQRAGAGWAVDPPTAKAAGGVVLGLAGLATAGVFADSALRRPRTGRRRRWDPRPRPEKPDAPLPGLHLSAGLLALSVFADSLIAHYRGNFENPGMYTPLAASALGMAVGLDGATAHRLPRRVRTGVYGVAAAVGAAGVAFHAYNVLRRPGGVSWLNGFYAAPVGAPAALSIAGLIGASAEALESKPAGARKLMGLPAGRVLSALTGVGLAGAVGEAGLLHFRGSFQNPFMWLPVSLPPLAAMLMGKAALEPKRPRERRLTRAWLWLTAALGLGGVGFHIFGVSRAMGGWRNWSQNVIDGPPIPAPPSFSALAIAALSALRLRDVERD